MEDSKSGRSPTEQTEALIRQLRSIAALSPLAWADLDLTMVQLRALFLVRAAQPLTVGELARRLDMRLASASALIDRLARADLVERSVDPEDRRRVRLTLGPAGQRLIAELDERAAVRFRTLLSRMSREGLDALDLALTELLKLARSS